MSDIIELIKSQPKINKIKEDIIEYNNQTLATKTKRGEELTAINVVYTEAIQMMGDEIFDLSVENDTLREKVESIDDKWLCDLKNKRKVIYDNPTKNNLILEKMYRQCQK